jgi:flavorubredoxin
VADHSTTVTSAVRPNQPARQVIATFDNYADAERAVDYLAVQHFEVDHVAIVGRDLELVEQVTGRINYGCAAPAPAG